MGGKGKRKEKMKNLFKFFKKIGKAIVWPFKVFYNSFLNEYPWAGCALFMAIAIALIAFIWALVLLHQGLF